MMQSQILRCASVIVAAQGAILCGATNSMTIVERAGVTTTNYPVQIGRPFVAGEIANSPQAIVNGTPVTTQADVKQRWTDGTVKHAILSFVIPSLPSNGSVTVTFRNQTSCNCGSGVRLTKAQMLDVAYDFDARIVLTSGTSATISARAILNAWNGTTNSYVGPLWYWTEGPVATTVILADHSTARANDVGSDTNRAFRPIFHATFWPGLNKVRIRFIGEISNTLALQNQSYNLELRTGNTNSTSNFSQTNINHTAASRWTKEYWIGGKPSTVSINHNLAYLAATKAAYNWDTTKTITESSLAAQYSRWTSAAKDPIYSPGVWDKIMPNAGLREDIGPVPTWVMKWLYTGDSRMQEVTLGQAQLATAWPMHYREGASGKWLDRARTTDSVGRILSLEARPTIWIRNFTHSDTQSADRIVPTGTISGNGWGADNAHQPEPFSYAYLLTGDFFFLEEAWFWSSWGVADIWPGERAVYPSTYGSLGTTGGNQLRGMGWLLRTRAQTAWITPDALPEKGYLEALLADAAAAEEGNANITGTSRQGNAMWNWGASWLRSDRFQTTSAAAVSNPFNLIVTGDPAFVQPPLVSGSAGRAIGLNEYSYFMVSLGRAAELYPSLFDPLHSYCAKLYGDGLTSPSYNKYLIGAYRFPTKATNGTFFSSWTAVKATYTTAAQNANAWMSRDLEDYVMPDSFAASTMAAVSFIPGKVSNGFQAWSQFSDLLPNGVFNDSPKYAIIPRSVQSSGPTCDLNGDGSVNTLDVQIGINQAIGTAACTNGDLSADGLCNIIDVQRLVNAALGQSCRLGP